MRVHPGIAGLEASAVLGLFTSADATRFGVSYESVAHHCRPGGRWERLYPSVFRVRAAGEPTGQRYLAALMWAGPDAVLSHAASARILDLDGIRSAPPELWSPTKRPRPGVIVHRGRLPAVDIVRSGPLRHTSHLRTARDLATVLDDDDLLELVVESVIRVHPGYEELLAGYPVPALARVLGRRRRGEPATESELETRYIQLMRASALPPPIRQYRVLDDREHCLARLDLAWPEASMWVELDGRRWHDTPEALLRDRRRQNTVGTRLGWTPLRFTWDDVIRRPRDTRLATEQMYRSRVPAGWRPAAPV